MINVNLQIASGRKVACQLEEGYTVADIKNLVQTTLGSTDFRLVVNTQEVQDNDPVKFAELKKSIRNNTTIYVLERMKGGAGRSGTLVKTASNRDAIIADLRSELCKVPTEQVDSECMICKEEEKCIKFCCGSIVCKECFSNHFIFGGYKITCLTCKKTIPPEKIFVTAQFIQSLNQLDETTLKSCNIDFQVCTCGASLINRTMRAKQQCNNCKRWLCFFFNTDWDETERKMCDKKYSCRVNCFWETKITYELLPLEYNSAVKVPSRRCCPKCFECGLYDRKCKYHTCKCGYTFCFICLNTKEDCMRIFNSQFDESCSNVAQQSYKMFPRLCHGK